MSLQPRDEQGITAVEFVLITPVLIIALLFTVGVARLAHARHQIESAAADAARAASLERNTSVAAEQGRSIAAKSIGRRGLSCSDLQVDVDVSAYEPGGVVRATVTCRAQLSDVAMAGFPGGRTFTATAAVPIETFRSN